MKALGRGLVGASILVRPWIFPVYPSARAGEGLGARLPWERSDVGTTWAQTGLKPLPRPFAQPPKNRYFHVPGKRRFVAFTFDDGPRPWTQAVLDALKERGLKGTF